MLHREPKSEKHTRISSKRISSNALSLSSPVTLRYTKFTPIISEKVQGNPNMSLSISNNEKVEKIHKHIAVLWWVL